MKNFKAKKLISLVMCVVLVTAAFSACAGNDENPVPVVKAEYAMVLKALSSDFWVKMRDGIQAEAKRLGVEVEIFAAQNEEDSAGQLTIMENCLSKGYKAIGVAPVSPTNLINGIVQANKKGIYVMNMDEKIDMETLKKAGGSVIGFATTDNEAVGEKAGKYIAEKLAGSGGDVAIIEGKAGNTTGESRKNGAKKMIEATSGLKLVASQPADWDRQKALDIATGYIQMYKNLKAIYCCNDTMALGAVQAVINAGKQNEIIVVGTDGTSEAVKSIESGQMSATIAQDPAEIGAQALREMVAAVKNQPGFDPNAQAKVIPIESKIITKE